MACDVLVHALDWERLVNALTFAETSEGFAGEEVWVEVLEGIA